MSRTIENEFGDTIEIDTRFLLHGSIEMTVSVEQGDNGHARIQLGRTELQKLRSEIDELIKLFPA